MDFDATTNFESAQFAINEARICINAVTKSRETALVITKLDEAEMWLFKAKANG